MLSAQHDKIQAKMQNWVNVWDEQSEQKKKNTVYTPVSASDILSGGGVDEAFLLCECMCDITPNKLGVRVFGYSSHLVYS